MNEYFFALVREGNRLRQNGTLSGNELTRAQRIVRDAQPILSQLTEAAQAYEAIRSSDNEDALRAAIARAAVSLSSLVNAIKAAGGSADLIREAERDLVSLFPLPA